MQNRKVTSIATYMTFASPVIGTMWLIAPMGVVQGIYAKYYGISLSSIGIIILISRIFDAISDPIVGHVTDNYYKRTGSYKPLIAGGGLLFFVSSSFLYIPFVNPSPSYLLFWFLAFYFSWSLFEIPHLAWAANLAPSSQEKSLIFSYRSAFGSCGVLLFYCIPLLPFFESQDITPETLKVSVVISNILFLVFLTICIVFTPHKNRKNLRNGLLESLDSVHLSDKQRLGWKFSTIEPLRRNKPLITFLCAYTLFGLGGGMWYGLIFIYVDSYLGLGDLFAEMFVMAFLIGILATPIWYKVANLLDKKYALLLSMSLLIISFIHTSFLGPSTTDYLALVILKVTQSIGYSGIGLIAPAMLSEIIDYGTWKTGRNSTSFVFSLYTFLTKTGIAIGSALGLITVSWFQFDPSSSNNSDQSVFGLSLSITWIPSFFVCIAIMFISLNPLNSRRHRLVQRRTENMSRRFEQSKY